MAARYLKEKQQAFFRKPAAEKTDIRFSAWITPEPGKYQCAVWDFSSFCA